MDWLAQLATSGATTLVGAAATDAWQHARDGFARLLGRGREDREAVAERRLQALAAEVERAPLDERAGLRQRLLPAWQTRLADLLEEDPAAAELLRGLVDEVRERLPSVQQQWVQHITATACGAVAQGVMFGKIINHPGQTSSESTGEAPAS